MIKIEDPFEILDLLYDNYKEGKDVEFDKIGVDYKNKDFFRFIRLLRKNGFIDADQTNANNGRYWGYFPKAKIKMEGIKLVMSNRATKSALELTRKSVRLTHYTLIVAIIALVLSVVFQFVNIF